MEKFNFTTKLHVACSDDELRPIMNCVHFVGGFAYASNGNKVGGSNPSRGSIN